MINTYVQLPHDAQMTVHGRVFVGKEGAWLSYPGRTALSRLAVSVAWADDDLRQRMHSHDLWCATGTWDGARFWVHDATPETEWLDDPSRCVRTEITREQARNITATLPAALAAQLDGTAIRHHDRDGVITAIAITIPMITAEWTAWAARHPAVDLLPVIEIVPAGEHQPTLAMAG